MRALARLLLRLRRDRSGVSAIEFAFLLPLLLVTLLGSIEAGRLILVTTKTQRASFTLGDLVTRDDTITVAKLTDAFLAIGVLFEPFDFTADGRAIVSSVRVASATQNIVAWQRFSGGTLGAVSQLGVAGATPTLPANLGLAVGETVIVTEIFYRYRPIFGQSFANRTISRISYVRPRLGTLDTITP